MDKLSAAISDEIVTLRQKKRKTRFLIKGMTLTVAAAFCFVSIKWLLFFETSRFKAQPAANDKSHQLPTPAEVWKIENIAAFRTSTAQMPVVSSGRIFTIEKAGEYGRIIALETRTGKVLWKNSQESLGYLAADSSIVTAVVPFQKHNTGLIAIRASTGKILWRYQVNSKTIYNAFTSPVVSDSVICWTSGNRIELINKNNGKNRWQRILSKRGNVSRPFVDGGIIYAASDDAVFCFSLNNKIIWKKPFTSSMSSLVQPQTAVSDGNLYISHKSISGCGELLCLDKTNGNELWRKSNEECLNLLAADGKLYVRSQTLRALDSRTGDLLWSIKTDGCAPPAYYADKIYLSESMEKATLLTIDVNKGEITHRFQTAGSCSGILITDGLEIVHSVQGILYAFRLDLNESPLNLPTGRS
jgi:outer membrane protein assembly factor BamB